MGQPKDRYRVTPQAIQEIAVALRKLAEAHDMAAKMITESKLESVDAMSMKTGVDGLINIGKFLGAIVEAYCDNLSAMGVGKLKGGVAEVAFLTKRLNHDQENARRVKAGVIVPLDPAEELGAMLEQKATELEGGSGGPPKKARRKK